MQRFATGGLHSIVSDNSSCHSETQKVGAWSLGYQELQAHLQSILHVEDCREARRPAALRPSQPESTSSTIPIRFQTSSFDGVGNPQSPRWCLHIHRQRTGVAGRTPRCECGIRHGGSRYPSWATPKITRNPWTGTPVVCFIHRQVVSNPFVLAALRPPVFLFGSAYHRAHHWDQSCTSLHCRSCNTRDLTGFGSSPLCRRHPALRVLQSGWRAHLAARIEAAISTVGDWMSSNRLRLNHDKTQFVWFGTRQQLSKRDLTSLANLSEALVSDEPTRNHGVLLDPELTMAAHVSKLCQVCFYQLRQIRTIRHSLSTPSRLTLVHAFISSRLDYCNSVLFGASSHLLDRLQLIQNAAARTRPETTEVRSQFRCHSKRAALAPRASPDRLQTLPACSKLFGWRAIPIPARTMCSVEWPSGSPKPTVFKQRRIVCSSVPHVLLRSTILLSRGTQPLEFAPRGHTSAIRKPGTIQEETEDSLVFVTFNSASADPYHWGALYKCRYYYYYY